MMCLLKAPSWVSIGQTDSDYTYVTNSRREGKYDKTNKKCYAKNIINFDEDNKAFTPEQYSTKVFEFVDKTKTYKPENIEVKIPNTNIYKDSSGNKMCLLKAPSFAFINASGDTSVTNGVQTGKYNEINKKCESNVIYDFDSSGNAFQPKPYSTNVFEFVDNSNKNNICSINCELTDKDIIKYKIYGPDNKKYLSKDNVKNFCGGKTFYGVKNPNLLKDTKMCITDYDEIRKNIMNDPSISNIQMSNILISFMKHFG